MTPSKIHLRRALLALLGFAVAAVVVIDGINRLGETYDCYNRATHDLWLTLGRSRKEILGECLCIHALFPACGLTHP